MNRRWVPPEPAARLDGAGFGIEQMGSQWRLTYQPHHWTTPVAIGGKFATYYATAEGAQAVADKINGKRAEKS